MVTDPLGIKEVSAGVDSVTKDPGTGEDSGTTADSTEVLGTIGDSLEDSGAGADEVSTAVVVGASASIVGSGAEEVPTTPEDSTGMDVSEIKVVEASASIIGSVEDVSTMSEVSSAEEDLVRVW